MARVTVKSTELLGQVVSFGLLSVGSLFKLPNGKRLIKISRTEAKEAQKKGRDNWIADPVAAPFSISPSLMVAFEAQLQLDVKPSTQHKRGGQAESQMSLADMMKRRTVEGRKNPNIKWDKAVKRTVKDRLDTAGLRAYRSKLGVVVRKTIAGENRTEDLHQLSKLGSRFIAAMGIQPNTLEGLQSRDLGIVEFTAALKDLKGAINELSTQRGATREHLLAYWLRHVALIRASIHQAEAEPKIKASRGRGSVDACKRPPGKGRCFGSHDDLISCIVREGGIKPDDTARGFLDVNRLREAKVKGLFSAKGRSLSYFSERLTEEGFISRNDEKKAGQLITDAVDKRQNGERVLSRTNACDRKQIAEDRRSERDRDLRDIMEHQDEIRDAIYRAGLPPGQYTVSLEEIPF